MSSLIRLIAIVVAAVLVASITAPAHAGGRKATSVKGWRTGSATLSLGSAISTRIQVRAGRHSRARQVQLQHRADGAWRVLDRARTNSRGVAQLRGVPASSGELRVVVRPTRSARAATTRTRDVVVAHHLRGEARRSARLASSVLWLVNRLRTTGTRCAGTWQRPVPRLSHDGRLAVAARVYAVRMATFRFFGHVDRLTGHGPGERTSRSGYDWSAVGENVAAGYATPRAVVRAWKRSPSHCRNLMDPRWRHMGVGWHHGGRESRWGHYWGQLFAQPAARPDLAETAEPVLTGPA